MSYFYAEDLLIPGTLQSLKGEEVRHIRLARKIREGEAIILQDPEQNRYRCTVTRVKNSYIEFRPEELIIPPSPPVCTLEVAVAAVKEKALDNILQKCTELGVARIILFQSEYSQRLPQGGVRAVRLVRWEKITAEACKQCGRAEPPEIMLYDRITDMLAVYPPESGFGVITVQPCEAAYQLPASVSQNKDAKLLLIIGPEGGFSPADLKQLPPVYLGLGAYILRADTAVLTAVSAVRTLLRV